MRIPEKIIGPAIEINKHFGLGPLESAYEKCLCIWLDL